MNFPPAPHGHYFQVKRGVYSEYPGAPWRVVLMRKVLGIFPVEVAGAEATGLMDEKIRAAADQAVLDFRTAQAEKAADRLRKAINRSQRKNAK